MNSPARSAVTAPTPAAIGWVGLDAPLELIEASDRRPQRLIADPAPPSLSAQTYGEGGGHPWMRALVNQLAQQGTTLERVVLCSTPVNELWLYNFLLSLGLRGEAGIFPAVSLLNLSHEGRPSAERFNIQALRDLAGTLGIAAVALNDRIVARNQVRAWLRRIDAQRRSPVAGMSGTDARRLMDPADSLRSEHYLAWAAAQPEPAAQRGLPVIYSSPRVPSLELYEALEARGLRIVGDDMDAGSRAIGPDVSEQGDPLEALARRYAARAPAPAGWSTSARVDFLLDMARLRGAKAILFDLPAWSHPAAWDYPAERGVLEASGIVCVELSCGSPTDSAEAAFTHLAGLIKTEAHHG